MSSSRIATWALAALVTSVSGAASLGPTRAAEPKPAERLHDAAVTAYRGGKLRQAIELWHDALKLDANWKYAYNLANTLYEVHEGENAWQALAQADRLNPPDKYLGHLAELRSKVRALLFKDHAWLALQVSPASARVTRDGARLEPPYDLWLTGAESTFEVAADGFVAQTVKVQHPIGVRTERSVALTALADVPPSGGANGRIGRIRVDGSPVGAKILVDGVERGTLPTTLELAPGRPRFTITHPHYRAEEREVEVASGREEPLTVTLVREPPKERPSLALPAWLSLGGGVALAGVGAGLVLWAGSDADDLDALNRSPEALAEFASYDAYKKHYESEKSALEDRRVVGQILIAAGSAAVITGIVLFVLDGGGGDDDASGTIVFAPLPGGGALVSGASF